MVRVCLFGALECGMRLVPLLVLVGLAGAGCDRKPSSDVGAEAPSAPSSVDSPSAASDAEASSRVDDIPRFAANSPFDVNDESLPEMKDGKRLWANSMLWEEAPELIVGKWLTEKPKTEGKCVLIEFWATWCPPCRKSVGLLNQFHQTFGDDLVVIGISDEPEQDVRQFTEPRPEYYLAIDTQHRTKDTLGVFGIPHVIILEPGGCVVWEGFPYLKGHELTEDVIRRILQVAREQRKI